MKYEIRQIDAWYDGEAWTYNESFRIGEFSTRAENVKRAFCRALHGLGVVFIVGVLLSLTREIYSKSKTARAASLCLLLFLSTEKFLGSLIKS